MSQVFKSKTLAPIERWGHGRVYDNIAQTIGNTPTVRLSRFAALEGLSAELLLKLEFFNPLASVKDRIGVSMIDWLEDHGHLTKDSILIEPTSGNTGIGLAFVCAMRGYRLILVMPESMSIERRKMFLHLGAELELTPASEGMRGALVKADEMVRSTVGAICPGQFANPANPAIHEQTTGEEIWSDTGGDLDALVVGIGTGGTITGCGRALKPRIEKLKIYAVEPADSPVLSGGRPGPHKIQGIGAGFVPPILERELIDEVLTVSNDSAFEISRRLTLAEGIPGGISTGANVAAAMELAKRPEMAGKRILTFAPSTSERYLSTPLFNEADS